MKNANKVQKKKIFTKGKMTRFNIYVTSKHHKDNNCLKRCCFEVATIRSLLYDGAFTKV